MGDSVARLVERLPNVGENGRRDCAIERQPRESKAERGKKKGVGISAVSGFPRAWVIAYEKKAKKMRGSRVIEWVVMISSMRPRVHRCEDSVVAHAIRLGDVSSSVNVGGNSATR